MSKAERPILFSGPMVRAILEGRKTQTRRVLKIDPLFGEAASIHPDGAGTGWIAWAPHPISSEETIRAYPGAEGFKCPYGLPGDRLWVRETWAARLDQDHLAPREISRGSVGYWADGPGKCCNTGCAGAAGKVRPSIFMPRWASRITLEITSVRAERLQDIQVRDIIAEGCPAGPILGSLSESALRIAVETRERWWKEGWDSINAKRGFGWDVNPWVWAVEFTPTKGVSKG